MTKSLLQKDSCGYSEGDHYRRVRLKAVRPLGGREKMRILNGAIAEEKGRKDLEEGKWGRNNEAS